MTLNLKIESSFKNKIKKLQKKHFDLSKLEIVLDLLVNQKVIPNKYKDHALKGNLQGYRECHIEKNWLLLYKIEDNNLILISTGTHDDFFK
ncbi:MAG: type II toxin-antitoxin system YafQ family toxin [Alphaproteobacteria bacterium]